jgi:hypothetical protein
MPPPQRESPGRESEASQSDSAADLKLASHSISGDDRHAAFVAGLELGKVERIEVEIEDRVLARLHQLSLEALGMARRHAADTGPAWAALIAWAGEPDE